MRVGKPVNLESLEDRRLLSTVPFVAKVNFQPAGAAVPAGYVADTGLVFASRDNGFSYGWDLDNRGAARDRNATSSSDQRYDTLTHTQAYGSRTWELAVPNGTYRVRVVVGDPSNTNSVYRVNVENTLAVSGTPSGATRWFDNTVTVPVSDGRLTVSNAAGANNNKLCFIEITQTDSTGGGGTGTGPATINVTTADASAAEAGGDPGSFVLTRTGDVSQPMTLYYALSGSATNGSDYQKLGGSVTFAAGAASATVKVTPIDDAAAEGAESVTLTVYPSNRYTLGPSKAATVQIADNDGQVPAGTTLVFHAVRAAQVGRSEGMGQVVGGKLYVFGGYTDTTYRPTRKAEVYDPAADAWRFIADLPAGVSHAGVAADGNTIWLAGGYPEATTAGSSQTFATRNVWKYDVVTNTWSAGPALPQARGGGSLVLLGRELHFFGGSDAARQDAATHWSLALDTPGASWVERAPLPAARNHLGGAALDGRVYAVGGQTGQDRASVFRRDVDAYDPAANAWTTVTPLPDPARSHIAGSTIVHAGRLLTLGGEGTGRAHLSNVTSFDPSANTWRDLTRLPVARVSGVAGSLDGNRIIFSGGYGAVSGGYAFTTTTWVGEFV